MDNDQYCAYALHAKSSRGHFKEQLAQLASICGVKTSGRRSGVFHVFMESEHLSKKLNSTDQTVTVTLFVKCLDKIRRELGEEKQTIRAARL